MSGSYQGYGARMRARLLEQGYKRQDGEPDVQRFCWDHRFNANHFHQWLGEKMAPFKDLIRLCEALDCSAEWLLTGVERKKAKPGRARRSVKNLLLALTAASAALLSPSAAPPIGNDAATLPPPSYRKLRRGIAYA